MPSSTVVIRDANTDDINFIYATMLRGLYHGCTFYSYIDKTAFYSNYGQVIDRLLLKPSISLKVACLADEADVIVGYAISEPGTLHFVYVKSAFRGNGIAKQLLGSSVFSSVTHITKAGDAIRLKKGWTFNPFLI